LNFFIKEQYAKELANYSSQNDETPHLKHCFYPMPFQELVPDLKGKYRKRNLLG
jgi:hypothetical protein